MARTVRTGADFDAESFQAWYGPIVPWSGSQVAALFAESGIRWAVAGGRAARAGAAAGRQHEDTDVEVPMAELSRLREHLADWHLWQVDDGALRPLLPDDELRSGVHQLGCGETRAPRGCSTGCSSQGPETSGFTDGTSGCGCRGLGRTTWWTA